ncbi:carbohydrate ABC transporter permease [Vibrio sp. ZSDE26]|uniref:Carbohydrate ABC transporter permease n=1 Tax=Vibrio amylolyticus TaxID=2847292 RepID=A0A9X2BH18_9VIBR|nr:carbohydrate ABC transporter permease [Vibrio amylolyticus]MCK6262475.1 carbohydrate ABC transporter permease [Vibrio amylolyticus]
MKTKLTNALMYAFLSLAAFISLFPFYWMIVSTTNTTTEINTGKFTFGDQLFANLARFSEQVDIALIFGNTAKIAIISTLLTLLISSMAGYGFEIYKNRNRDRVYTAMLLTMMIPFAAMMIPLFTLMAKMNLLDTHFAVILPTVASVFIVFYFRQCTKAFPNELIDAARVDGVSEWKIYLYVYLPVMKTTYAAAFIIVFMGSWNAFLWPLIVLQSAELKTINLVLSSMSSAYFPDFSAIMVGTVLATLPTLAVFFLMQKQFVAGMTGSVK